MQKRINYLINSPKIVDEIFEDEIIIINFDNGNYFSLRGSAIDIWKGIKNGYSTDLISEDLQSKYEVDEVEVGNMLTKLIDDFLNEELISLCEEGIEENNPLFESLAVKKSFESPVFEKFTDMNDLLLLDPVHDVDEKGWPHTNSGQ